MTSAVPLKEIPVDALAPVLDAQRAEWLARLDWDFSDISALVEDMLRERALHGTALVGPDGPVGFGFFVPEPGRCLIGEIYIAPAHRTAGASRELARRVVAEISESFGRRRVESQSVHFDTEGLSEAFAEAGFSHAERFYEAADLAAAPPGPPTEHSLVRVRPWVDEDFGPAHEVIYRAYRGGVDARASSGYRTRDGCADLLDALTDSVWCGRFDPALTRVAVDRRTGKCCGVAIASRISGRAAHLGQISVDPARQGRGVGRALVESALAGARDAGLSAATLAVSAENGPATRLYERCGFRPRLAFPVFYRDPR